MFNKRVFVSGTVLTAITVLSACTQLKNVGQEPEFSAPVPPVQPTIAPYDVPLDAKGPEITSVTDASLWTGNRGSLLGDRRAMQQGDILTVVIEIDDSASISNSTSRSRSGSESLGIPEFFGIPQVVNESLPEGATLGSAVSVNSSSNSDGDGSVTRNERLTLRVAATILDVLPNGVLAISGTQEVRVNFELRELLVTGYVRPEDISRQNEITYDKIASARISYGGRGQITDMQQPRRGQQVTDAVLPF